MVIETPSKASCNKMNLLHTVSKPLKPLKRMRS